MSETEILSRSFKEYDGAGNVIYANSFQIGAHFSVRMLQNGSIKGELRFHCGVHFQGANYPRLLECHAIFILHSRAPFIQIELFF
jgi:hypothetical protein